MPTALAAPVDEGMMLEKAARPPRQSLRDGASTHGWDAVTACTVFMSPDTMPNSECRTLATGARQLVVQDAFETAVCGWVGWGGGGGGDA